MVLHGLLKKGYMALRVMPEATMARSRLTIDTPVHRHHGGGTGAPSTRNGHVQLAAEVVRSRAAIGSTTS